MPNTKPLVAVATLCEQILEEKDGVVSVIRVVDTYHVEPPKDLPAGKVAVIALKLLLSLKSGDLTGSHEVRVALRRHLPANRSSFIGSRCSSKAESTA
jgi:hypothetical protein